jgi:hypothetical protein
MEILFGVIMVMTLTGSISIAEGGAADTGTVLAAAIGCNLAWGIIDAAMYLMASVAERARGVATLRAIRDSGRNDAARRLIVDALPAPVSAVLTPLEIETLRVRLKQQPAFAEAMLLRGADVRGAVGVFLLVSLSTLPLLLPFAVMRQPGLALRLSNAIAIALLFVTGWWLGRYAGRPGWRTGLSMVAAGVVLVGLTIALGG